jgi:phosphatidylserine decarboxylase
MNALKNSFFYIILFLLPKNLISCLMGKLVSIRFPARISARINQCFARHYNINLSEAGKPLAEYPCLQDFFIRQLKPGLRPISLEDNVVISPCDGMLSSAGRIERDLLIQAKGKLYSVHDLLDDPELAAHFYNGCYATLYLSPRDYHRFHVPMDGEIQKSIYLPGSLWPVNRWAVSNINNLFCQNERIISLIAHEASHLMLAHIAVGATMVGKIELDYGHMSNRPRAATKNIENKAYKVRRGETLGKFMFGSTIILLFQQGLLNSFAKTAPSQVKMGEILGKLA